MADKWSQQVTYSSPFETHSRRMEKRRSLLARLEERLQWALGRAQEAARSELRALPTSIVEVVAVVGVVVQFACTESVNDLVLSSKGKAAWPNLYAMLDRRRFDYFHLMAAVRSASPALLSAASVSPPHTPAARAGAGGSPLA